MAQDEYHFLWLGTAEGLCRYDGQEIMTFTTKDGLDENFINTSFVDKFNNKWLGHYQGGITFFNNKNFKIVDTKRQINSRVNKFYQTNNSGVFVCTQSNGLWKVNYKLESQKIGGDEYWPMIWDMIAVGNNEYLIATGEGCFYLKLDDKNNIISKTAIANTDLYSILNIVKTDSNTYLLGTEYEGIFKLTFNSVNNNKLEKINSDKKVESEGRLVFIEKDRNGNIWISTENGGLTLNRFENNTFEVKATFDIDFKYYSTFCRSVLLDTENDLWIGTYGNGLYESSKNIFLSYSTTEDFTKRNIKSLAIHNNKVFFAENSGLYEFNIITKKYKKLGYKIDLKPQDVGAIKSIYIDDKNKIYLSFENQGVYVSDINNLNFKLMFCKLNDKPSCTINNMVKQSENSFWFATENGAYNLNPNNNAIKKLSIENGLPHNKVYYTFLDSKKRVWFATHGSGITYYDSDHLVKIPSPLDSKGIDISTIFEDHNHDIWFGTYGQGILRLHNGIFDLHYTKNEGLGSNFCYTIIEDGNNNLWIGHKNGFSKISSETRLVTFYDNLSEYSDAEVNLNSLAVESKSEFWYGTNQGLLKFDGNNDRSGVTENYNLIKGVKLFFEEPDWNKLGKEREITSPPQNIKLSYNNNHITFEFIGISLKTPEKVKYKFFLQGFDYDWSLPTKQNYATYANLPHGKYTFKVISMNKDGKWNEEPASYSFEITPPFWLTWWFICLAFISVVSLIVWIYIIRTNHLNRKIARQQEEKERLEHEIGERIIVEQKLQESQRLLQISNEELHELMWRLYHDLRSPLKSIQGLINIALLDAAGASKMYFELINSSAEKLDSILKDFSRVKIIKNFDFKVEKIDLCALIEKNINELGQKFPLDNYFIQNTCQDSGMFYSDASLVEICIYNVLKNAFEYRSVTNHAVIKIKVKHYEKYSTIIISDNGQGIPKEALGKVFTMFYRANDKSKGNGLGLYIAKKNIEILNGKIAIFSKFKTGTTVVIQIPSMMEPTSMTLTQKAALQAL